MKNFQLTLFLAARNLLRQKRRNIFLGSAIAFGMAILITANSFSHGITDNLLNRVLTYLTGHLEVVLMEDSRQNLQVIRDRERFLNVVQKHAKNIQSIREDAPAIIFLVGNGKSEPGFFKGVNLEKESFEKEFLAVFKQKVLEGNLNDMRNEQYENPVVIFASRAKALNLKLHDKMKVRLSTIYGQQQSARLTVVAILKEDAFFQAMSVFISAKTLKDLQGYKPYESGGIQVNFKNTNSQRKIIETANKIYDDLEPLPALIYAKIRAKIQGKDNSLKNDAAQNIFVNVYGFDDKPFEEDENIQANKKTQDDSSSTKEKFPHVVLGQLPSSQDRHGVLISQQLLQALQLQVGDSLTLEYPLYHQVNLNEDTESANVKKQSFTLKILGVYQNKNLPPNVLLMHKAGFYKQYLYYLPHTAGLYKLDKNLWKKHFGKDLFVVEKTNPLYNHLSKEWKKMQRSSTSKEFLKKIQSLSRKKWKAPALDVRTMYESASMILDLEFALNIVTFSAILVLFFIVLIGVVNTLRMTIRERTREIGSMRAIGMQSSAVRDLFITETLLLTLVSALVGVAGGFLLMFLISSFTIETQSVLSILLVDKHIYFVSSFWNILTFVFLILLISAITAYFPSRKAAKLSAADALRHYE